MGNSISTKEKRSNCLDIHIVKDNKVIVTIAYNKDKRIWAIIHKSFGSIWKISSISTLLSYLNLIFLTKGIDAARDELTIESTIQINLPFSKDYLHELLIIFQSIGNNTYQYNFPPTQEMY
jgi:hypothetical protein